MRVALAALMVLTLTAGSCENEGTQSGAGSGNNIQAGGDATNCTVVGSQGSGSCNTTTTTTTTSTGAQDLTAPIRADCSLVSQQQGICRLPPTEP